MKLYVYFLFWHYVLQSKQGFACSDGLFTLIPVYFISWIYHNLFAWSDIHGHWDSRSGLFCIVPGWILKYFLMNFCMSLHSSSYRTIVELKFVGHKVYLCSDWIDAIISQRDLGNVHSWQAECEVWWVPVT